MCCWALSKLASSKQLELLSSFGTGLVDVRAEDIGTEALRAGFRVHELRISCVALPFSILKLPPLSSPACTETVQRVKADLDAAQHVGATTAYLVPDLEHDRDSIVRFSRRLEELAAYASTRDVRLCLEHFPGRGLPTIRQTIEVIEGVGHPNLALVLDLGHAQITGEDAAETLRRHRELVGYIHLDDNDGSNDLHQGLFEGVLAKPTLERLLRAAHDTSWPGPLAIELSSNLDDPAASIERSVAIVRSMLEAVATS